MRVVILAPPGVQSLDVVGPAEVFCEAAKRSGNTDAYEVRILSTGQPWIAGTGNMRFVADGTILEPDSLIDTLLVAGDPSFGQVDPIVISWLKRQAPEARRFGSICTGIFLLAEAGLLGGRRVTTHWECAGRLASQYPDTVVDADAIFVRDGELCTAAGVTAGIDLALALVEEDLGRSVAMQVARYMVMFMKRPGGQSQFSAHLIGQLSSTTPVHKAQDFILRNLASPLLVDKIAREVGMSGRNFARIFHREIGMTPGQFIDAARTDAARRLLEESTAPLQRIATLSGFTDPQAMRRAFGRVIGVSPQQYRERFQSSRTTEERLPPSTFSDKPSLTPHEACASIAPIE